VGIVEKNRNPIHPAVSQDLAPRMQEGKEKICEYRERRREVVSAASNH
jgi:hypothetical protein